MILLLLQLLVGRQSISVAIDVLSGFSFTIFHFPVLTKLVFVKFHKISTATLTADFLHLSLFIGMESLLWLFWTDKKCCVVVLSWKFVPGRVTFLCILNFNFLLDSRSIIKSLKFFSNIKIWGFFFWLLILLWWVLPHSLNIWVVFVSHRI